MFHQIRRHQKWLWILISGAVIISFVWYFNPNQRWSRRGGGGGYGGEDTVGMIYGEPIHHAEYSGVYREAVLHYLFSYGEWPTDNEINRQMRPVEREARQRLVLVRKLKDYNIEVSDQAVADWIAQVFQDRETKRFHKEVYDRFLTQLEQRKMKPADFERYARHQVGIAHLAAIAGSSGRLVTPQEAEQVFRDEHEQAKTKVVAFAVSNFVARVQITPETIGTFYTNQLAAYRLPERVQLSYVPFAATNYMAKAEQTLAAQTNLQQQIDAMYLQRGPSYYADLNGQPMTPEAAKSKIRDEIKKDAAMAEARRDAFAFANELEKIPVKTNSPNPAETLENLASAKGLAAQITEPFSQFRGPANLNLPDQFVKGAFRLSPEEPIVQEPVPGEDGFYVMAFKNRLPADTQPLEAIREKVTEDFRRNEAQRLATDAARSFQTTLTNALAAGQSIDAVAQQAGVTVIDLPPFSKDSRTPIANLPPAVNERALRSTAFNLSPGHASSYQPGPDGGFIVYLERFIPAAEDEVKNELPQFTTELQRRKASEAFNEWFGKQMQLAQLKLAGDKGLEEQE